MVKLIRPNGAVILLGLLCVLGLVELLAAFMEYRPNIDEDGWDELAAIVEQRGEDPVIVPTSWLSPAARMNLAQARSWDALAYPDLRSFASFWLLHHKLERPWRGSLRAELEGAPLPDLVEIHHVGRLTLERYEQSVGVERFDLLDRVEAVRTGRGPCRGGRGMWQCKDGRVSIRTLEIDYRPRRCLAVELDDGVVAEVELGEVELGDRIRGHVGFGDFNARLRADPSARVELLIDEVVAARWLFTDDQGWAAFALATEPGAHRVQLRASTSVGGTWQRDGHRTNPTDSLCIELRGFDEGGDG